ncbi:MAG TPA: MdtA/MuxA family multidrug efflux RND transporter periplasmic adaptor subunit [Beijerinckiaceae bacterium]|nr:MdtA/MuxA family multidrug efflux RND transporter periplasmic adaptor subunit [Beijerinckiaceae bacterium]
MDELTSRAKPAPESPINEPPAMRPRPRRRWGRLLLLLIAVLVGYVLVERIRNGREFARGPRGAPAQSIGSALAFKGNMPITIDALGAVTPLATVTVRTQISGQLQRVGFQEGQMVKAGDFLAQIDPRPYQVALEQAQGTRTKDRAALAQAQSDLARYQVLTRQDSISRQQVEDQQFLVRQDQAATSADQAQVDSAKLNLSYCRIVAPISGRVGLRQVDAGNYLQPSDTGGIVVITQIQPISVIFSIPEDGLPEVMARMKSGAKLPVTVFDRSNTVQLAVGTLDTTDNQIDPTTGTIKLRATFQNGNGALFPNQFVNARLLVDTLSGAVLVPNAAVQRGAPGTFVYLVKDNKVSVAKIKTGPSDGADTTVLSGLAPGQSVVVDGADRLSDGAQVVVRNEAASPASAPPPAKGSRRKGAGRSGP